MPADNTPERDVLLLGFGNPGRLDDGLGPGLVKAMEEHPIPGLEADADYQLTIEDAHRVANHRTVIFADAHVSGPEPFTFTRIEPVDRPPAYTSHDLEPCDVMSLATSLFGARTDAYLLAIRGYTFGEFGEGLSQQAHDNLQKAYKFLKWTVTSGQYDDALALAGNNDSEGQHP